MERILFRFAKDEAFRFVGHLDLMRVIERAMRRSRFPIAYSQGFNPRPRMALASALTLGATSAWELCQLDLARDTEEAQLEEAMERLRKELPHGLRILDVWPLPLEKRNPYIQVRAAAYELTLMGAPDWPPGEAGRRLERFLEEGPGLPQALERAVASRSGMDLLQVTLPVGERTGVRIRDLVAVLEQAVPGLRVTRLHRARLWCEQEPAASHGAGCEEHGGTSSGEPLGTSPEIG